MASATTVRVGFSAAPVVNWLPSEMNRFLMSCVWPHLLTTPSLGFSDMRLVPRLCVDGYGGVGNVRVAPTASYKAEPCLYACARMAASFGWSSKETSGTGRPNLSFTVLCRVTRFLSCGMSSPTIHMPAMLG